MSEPETPPASAWLPHLIETYKSLVTLAVEILKTIIFINGAAAVAVLTFFGNVASRAAPDYLSHVPSWHLRRALIFYTLGVGVAAAAWVSGYITQWYIYEEELVRRASVPWGGKFVRFFWLTIVLMLLPVGAFLAGSWYAALALLR